MLVFVHGFAASGAAYYSIYKHLIQKFVLVTIDLIGMGQSSRPDNFKVSDMTPQKAVDYFTDYIEQWAIEIKLQKFYLAAHSFGGYVSGHYACKYPHRIHRLLLISPLGLRVKPPGEDDW